jgi:hypothetical protein
MACYVKNGFQFHEITMKKTALTQICQNYQDYLSKTANPSLAANPALSRGALLGDWAFQRALSALALGQVAVLPDMARIEKCAYAIADIGALVFVSLLCVKGQTSVAQSKNEILASWAEKMGGMMGEEVLKIAAAVLDDANPPVR